MHESSIHPRKNNAITYTVNLLKPILAIYRIGTQTGRIRFGTTFRHRFESELPSHWQRRMWGGSVRHKTLD
jgi:hypothetical protein